MTKKILGMTLLTASLLLGANVKVENAYVRATPPGLPNSAAFMSVKNDGSKELSIVKATSTVAKKVELHTHDMKDGVMKMYQVPEIKIPAKSETVLKPGGFHIMLIGLHNPLKVGENVNLTLTLSNGNTIDVSAPVKTVMGGMKHNNMKSKAKTNN